MSDLTDQQIETLAFNWPWEYHKVEAALRLADAEGLPFDDTVRALDALAADFGDEADPEQIITAAIAYKRSRFPRGDYNPPSTNDAPWWG